MAEKKTAPVKDIPDGMVKVYILEDHMGNNIKAYGWINEKYYEYPMGTYQVVPKHIAEHMICCHQAK